MDFYRATENDYKYIKYERCFVQSTALIASNEDKVVGVLEYDITNIEEVEIVNFIILDSDKEGEILKGLMDEMMYWNPYLKRIIYKEENSKINPDILVNYGFKKNYGWLLATNNDIEVFKINIDEIIPEQLTVDEVKLNRVASWIEKPEDIVVSCVKIGDKIVSIDGHSRLVAAYNKGFKYVYAYLETDNDSIEFYKTCMKWCENEKIFTIKDLANRVVTTEKHSELWINRCQRYLKDQRNKEKDHHIETERLYLKPMTLEMVEFLIKRDNEKVESLGFKLGNGWPTEDTMDILPIIKKRLKEENDPTGFEDWMVIKKESNEVIGDIGFKDKPNILGEVEIGYGFIEEERGKSYGFESLKAMINWAFNQEGVRCVKAECLIENKSSARILEKVGMKETSIDEELIYWKLFK